MTITPKILYSGGQMPSSAGVLYTTPVNTKAVISAASFVNTDTVARQLTVYIVRSGGAPGAANVAINALPLTPNVAYVSAELQSQELGPGDTIQALADAANVLTCAGISGYEIV